MPIVGFHPETGLRVVLERPREGGPPWLYEGHVFTRDAKIDAHVRVDAGGEVHAALVDPREGPREGARDPALVEKVKLIVRAAHKHSAANHVEAPPPRRIVRWRGEK